MRTSFIFFLLIHIGCPSALAQDELKVVQGDNQWLQFSDTRNSLYHHFAKEAYAHLQHRKKLLSGIETRDEWKQRQQWIKERLHEMLGPFPERTPLNAKIVRTVEKEGYRIEHIVYESQPGFYVASSLFISSTQVSVPER